MTIQSQERKRLRISDQDALLKWCRSNGFVLAQRVGDTTLAFDISRRATSRQENQPSDFLLSVAEKDFTIRDANGEPVVEGKELRDVLKQLSAFLAGSHSAAS